MRDYERMITVPSDGDSLFAPSEKKMPRPTSAGRPVEGLRVIAVARATGSVSRMAALRISSDTDVPRA